MKDFFKIYLGHITYIILGILFALFIWGSGFLIFIYSLNKPMPEMNRNMDAIIILTGGSNRIKQGVELFKKGLSDKVFISGVYKDTNLKDLISDYKDLECCIELGYKAKDTLGNAIETRDWIAGKDIKSIILVTANYHIKRSMLEFTRVNKELEIIPYPIKPASSNGVEWWRNKKSIMIIINEYNKFIGALLYIKR